MSFNSLTDNGVGLQIAGDNNDVKGGTVADNSGNGVVIAASASGNTFSGATVRDNAGSGIVVAGPGNTLQSNKINNNGGNGVHVTATATGTVLQGNQSNQSSGRCRREHRVRVQARRRSVRDREQGRHRDHPEAQRADQVHLLPRYRGL